MGNTQSLVDAAANRWPVVLTALLVCFVAAIAPKVGSVLRLWTIPIVGEELGSTEKRRKAYLGGARKLYSDGYQKVRIPIDVGDVRIAHHLIVQKWRFHDYNVQV